MVQSIEGLSLIWQIESTVIYHTAEASETGAVANIVLKSSSCYSLRFHTCSLLGHYTALRTDCALGISPETSDSGDKGQLLAARGTLFCRRGSAPR